MFIGCKIALLCEGTIAVLLRDDAPGLRYANMWDLPGGGREPGEAPEQTLRREVAEEIGIAGFGISSVFEKASDLDPMQSSWFFVSHIAPDLVAQMRLGDEGQAFQMMPLTRYLADPQVIGFQKQWVADYLAGIGRQS
ncbi:NUDIX domain-containing protein [Algirhabdus cladophorae]|uniref:NUDIX domain-containing protein n=1 Tax=Algirhabdus cladophorae TaxID=3377108 RepID=UPI003B848C88